MGQETWRENNSHSEWMGHLNHIILFFSSKSMNRILIKLGQNIDQTEQNTEQIDLCFVRMMMIFRPTYTF